MELQHVYFNNIDLGYISNFEDINQDLVIKIVSSLNMMQTLSIMAKGYIEIGKIQMENWKKEKMFYLFKCPVHGYQISYPSGYSEKLQCLPCLRQEYGLEMKEEILVPSQKKNVNNLAPSS